jgi:hypothetical protein
MGSDHCEELGVNAEIWDTILFLAPGFQLIARIRQLNEVLTNLTGCKALKSNILD